MTTIETGSRLGEFAVLDKLGKGGMGEVYLAEDLQLGRKVAIKVVADRLRTDDEARERLLEEARLASALNHPNICTIYQVVSTDDELYLVMELVEGTVLRNSIYGNPLPVETVLAYGIEIASGLGHAHQNGILHRDLKPGNVMIGIDGRVKILDFGLAQRQGTEVTEATTIHHASSNDLAGTPLYMAPEQMRAGRADTRTDIWSLGVVLYQCASGGHPFKGRTFMELAAEVLKETPAPLPPHVPKELSRVIMRCLSKEPSGRYQQAGEVRAALEVVQLLLEGADATDPHLSIPEPETRLSDSVTLHGIRSLAVLPLTNLSQDPQQEYFSDGMTEALINILARIAALRVISRTTAMRYRGSVQPLPEIADELRVDAVVEGSVAKAGNQVRITVQLVHAPTDTPLWAESYTRELKDIFSLQTEVAKAIAQGVRVKLTPKEQKDFERRETSVNPQAHKAYLKGRHCRNLITGEGFTKAIEYAQQAIDIDPENARAHSLMAETFLLQGMYGFERPREVFPRAKRHATTALTISDALAEAHSTWAWAIQLMDLDRRGCEQEYEKALELNPGHEATLMRYGSYLTGIGRQGEGIALLKKSIELDPLSRIMNAIYAYGLYLMRDFEGCIAHCDTVLEWESEYWWFHWDLGEAFLATNRGTDAVKAHERAYGLSRNAFTAGALGRAYALAGERGKAEAILTKMIEQSETRYVSPYFIATIYVGLGHGDKAVKWLARAWNERDSWVSFINVNPALDPVRDHPGFDDVLREMDFI